MWLKAHESVAEHLNGHLKNPFPLELLIMGSTDPDSVRQKADPEGHRIVMREIGEYTKEEKRKHHYDNKAIGRARLNDTDVIRKKAWNRVRQARECWLKENKRGAAIRFGIASHFALDGLIESNSMGRQGEAQGEPILSREALRPLFAKHQHPGLEDEVADEAYANKALRDIASRFGMNDQESVPPTFDALVRIGWAVTEDPVPGVRLKEGRDELRKYANELTKAVHDYGSETEQVLESLQSRAETVLQRSPRYRRALGIKELFVQLQRRNFSLCAHFLSWRFTARCRKMAKEGVREASSHLESRAAQSRSSFRTNLQKMRNSWFSMDDYVKKWQEEATETNGERQKERARLQNELKRKSVHVIEAALSECRQKALTTLPQWWRGSRRGKIGSWSGCGNKWLPIIAVILVPYFGAVLSAVRGNYRISLLSMMGALFCFFLPYVTLRHWEIVSAWVKNSEGISHRLEVCIFATVAVLLFVMMLGSLLVSQLMSEPPAVSGGRAIENVFLSDDRGLPPLAPTSPSDDPEKTESFAPKGDRSPQAPTDARDETTSPAAATGWDGERAPVSSEFPEPRVSFRSDKISIQTATQRVCKQAGFYYDWSRSYGNTQPDCRRYIRVDVTDVPLRDALDAIVSQNGLRYRIDGKNVWLER